MNDKFEKVKISKSMAACRNIDILLVGRDRLTSDIELILEDKWRQIRHVESSAEAKTASHSNPPSILIAWHQSDDPSLLKLIEMDLADVPKRILVFMEGEDTSQIRMLSRRAAVTGVHLLEVPPDPNQASKLIDEILEGVADKPLSNQNLILSRIRSAYQGFLIGAEKKGTKWQCEKSDRLALVTKFLLSKFSILPDTAVQTLLYAEVYDFVSSFKQEIEGTQLATDLSWLENEIRSSEFDTLKLIELAVAVRDFMRQGGFIPQARWEEILKKSAIGKLAIRKLNRSYVELRSFCENDKRQKKDSNSTDQHSA